MTHCELVDLLFQKISIRFVNLKRHVSVQYNECFYFWYFKYILIPILLYSSKCIILDLLVTSITTLKYWYFNLSKKCEYFFHHFTPLIENELPGHVKRSSSETPFTTPKIWSETAHVNQKFHWKTTKPLTAQSRNSARCHSFVYRAFFKHNGCFLKRGTANYNQGAEPQVF